MSNTEYTREGAHRLRLGGMQCQDCGFVTSLLSRKLCPSCHGGAMAPVNLAGRGSVATLTTVHYPPAEFEGLEPYDIVLVDIQPSARVVAPAIRRQGRRVAIGDTVEPTLRRIKFSAQDGLIHYGVKFGQTPQER